LRPPSPKSAAPPQQILIGKLQNDPRSAPARQVQHLGSISRNPNRWRPACPGKTGGLTFVVNLASSGEFTERLDSSLKIAGPHGLFAQHPPGAVAAANAELHAPSRNEIEGGEQAGSHRDV